MYAKVLSLFRFGCLLTLTVLLVKPAAFAQEKVFTGTIRSEKKGTLLPYVNIININRKTGTSSNEYGLFQIVGNEEDTLALSSIGFETKIFIIKEALSGSNLLTITLNELEYELRAVQVDGRMPWEQDVVYQYRRRIVPEKPLGSIPAKAPTRISLGFGSTFNPNQPFMIEGVLGYLYDQYSVKGKSLKKYNELLAQDMERELIRARLGATFFERTGLTDSNFTIDYLQMQCGLSYYVLSSVSDYDLYNMLLRCIDRGR